MQCSRCSRPLNEDAVACPQCGANLACTVYASDGKQYGPYSMGALRRYVAEGRIAPNAQVSMGGGPWVPVGQVLQAAPVAPTAPVGPVRPVGPVGPVGPMGPVGAPAMAYARPAKKKGMGTGAIVAIVIVAVVVVVGGLAAFGLSGAGRRLDPNATKTCRSNLKQLGLGMLMYSQDYDEVFPIEATWKDAVYPYTKNEQLLECPASRLGRDSYEMFPPLSGLGLSYIPAPAETPMVYDAGFLKGGKAPHSEGFNVTFSDGHCKAVGSSEASRYQTSSTP